MPVENKLFQAHVVENNYMRCDRRNPLSIVETMRYLAVNVENRRQQPAGSYSLATGVGQVVIALENAPSVLGAELSVVGTALRPGGGGLGILLNFEAAGVEPAQSRQRRDWRA